jgi:phosphoglycolate phosphatase
MGLRCKAVLFDFDYTLADSSPGVIECVNHALERLGRPAAGDDAIRRTIGLSLEETFLRLVGDLGGGQADEFRRHFVERADQLMADRTTVFAAVPRVLQRLRSAGLRLGVVSTKFRYRLEDILGREGLLPHFDVIVGSDDVKEPKPDPEGLRRALAQLGVDPEDAVYVGDSVVDAETAARAGVRFVAVLSGMTRRSEFASHTVEAVLADVDQLADHMGW